MILFVSLLPFQLGNNLILLDNLYFVIYYPIFCESLKPFSALISSCSNEIPLYIKIKCLQFLPPIANQSGMFILEGLVLP
jgi:hypothetical protein